MNFVIIDGHNLLFRSYAVPFKFFSPNGTPLHVVTTFLSLLRRALLSVEGTELVVVFDAEEPTTNHALSIHYKANRDYDYSENDDSPFDHLPIIKGVLDKLGIFWLEQQGLEADDVIASLSHQYLKQHKKSQVFIASSDTDFFQLLNHRIKMIKFLPKGKFELLDSQYVEDRFGVAPDEFVELKSWVGDKSDNIRGINGIGWIRGVEVLQGKRLRALTDHEAEQLELNRELIRLNCNLVLDIQKTDPKLLLEMSNREIFDMCGL